MTRATSPVYAGLLDAIRRGRITSATQAAERFGVSRTTIQNQLRMARAAGHRIATRTGGRWEMLS